MSCHVCKRQSGWLGAAPRPGSSLPWGRPHSGPPRAPAGRSQAPALAAAEPGWPPGAPATSATEGWTPRDPHSGSWLPARAGRKARGRVRPGRPAWRWLRPRPRGPPGLRRAWPGQRRVPGASVRLAADWEPARVPLPPQRARPGAPPACARVPAAARAPAGLGCGRSRHGLPARGLPAAL